VNRRDRAWSLETVHGVEVVRCPALDPSGRFGHAFSTRVGGGVCGAGSDPLGGGPESFERRFRERVMEAAGLGRRPPILLEQVHGAQVATGLGMAGRPRADGFLVSSFRPDRIAGIRTADCFPVLVVDPEAGIGTALHAGWRGAAAGILSNGVKAMVDRGADPGTMTAAIGPGIGSCCFLVGPEVAEALPNAEVSKTDSGLFLDLASGIRAELAGLGLSPGRIHTAPWCTCCEPEKFFSYRRDGDPTGRMLTVLGVTRAPGAPP